MKAPSSILLHPETPGTIARRGRGREAEIAQAKRTVQHLRKMHAAAMDKGNTALALEITGRIQRIEARNARYEQ